MLDFEFCLETFNSSLTEDGFDDNPFSLDFSDDADVVISPSSSEDEKDDDDDEIGAAEEDNQSLPRTTDEGADTVMMVHPLSNAKLSVESVYSNSEIMGSNHHTNIVQNIDDRDEPLPLEFFDITSSSSHIIPITSISWLDCSTSAEKGERVIELASLTDAKKKLDECMRRTDHTRRWIKQYVKKPGRMPLATTTTTRVSKAVTPSVARPSASFAKHSFRKRGRGGRAGVRKAPPTSSSTCKKNKNTFVSAVQLVRDASVFVREKGSRFASTGVLHRPINLIPDGSSATKTGRTTKVCSISDYLRQHKKPSLASMMMTIY